MAKNSITDYDNIAANNTDIQSVDIDEGCAPSGINNAIRELMADLADVNDGTVPLTSPDINGGTIDGVTIGGTTAGAGTFTGLTVDSASGITVNGPTNQDGKLNLVAYAGVQNAEARIIAARGNTSGTDSRLQFLTNNGTSLLTRVDINDNGDISFYEDTGTTPKFFWDASAEALGIGTSSPSAPIHLVKATSVHMDFQSLGDNRGKIGSKANDLYIGQTSSAANIIFKKGVNSTDHPADSGTESMRIDSSGNVMSGVTSTDAKLYVTNGASPQSRLIVGGGGGAANTLYTILSGGNNIQFETNGSERMRIDSLGNLLVGTTVSEGPSQLSVVQTDTNQAVIACRHTLGAGEPFVRFINSINNAIIGTIVNSGNTGTAYNTSSDYRLKEDMQPMTGAIERVNALNPVNFAWKVDGSRVDGFLAHEAQAVVPEAVTGTKDAMQDEEYEVTPAVLDEDGNVVAEAVMGTRSVPNYQGIDQSKLVPLLTAALQEAIAEIETLKTKVAALENA